MVVNAIFNNISVISWRSVLFVEESGLPGENHRPAASHWKLYHIMLYRVHLTCAGFELTTVMVIGIDYIGICKSNYYTITTTLYYISVFTSVVCYCQNGLRRKHGKCSLCNEWWHSFMNQRLNHYTIDDFPWCESLYSPKLKVINCFNILH